MPASHRSLATSALTTLLAAASASAQLSITQIGSSALGVSADGSVVCGDLLTPTEIRVFRWTASTGLQDLGQGGAADISRDGTTIVGQNLTGAYRWRSSTGFVNLGTLPGSPAGNLPGARDASGNGDVVVGTASQSPGVFRGFRWTSSTGMVVLGDLPGGNNFSQARSISADGSVIVGSSIGAEGERAVRWASGSATPISLGSPAGLDFGLSEAASVSGDSQVIVGTWLDGAGENQMFRWTAPTGMTLLGDLPGGIVDSVAYATNFDGSVVAGTGNPGDDLPDEAIIWTQATGVRSLRSILLDGGVDLTAWSVLSIATDLSDDGSVVVGQGLLADGVTIAGFRAVIPAPSVAVFTPCALAMPLLRGARRRTVRP
jgi:uncharacterized membrane protein